MNEIFKLIKENKLDDLIDLVNENPYVLREKNELNESPFYCAVRENKCDIVAHLLNEGGDPNLNGPKNGLTAMSYFFFVNNTTAFLKLKPMLELLLQYGADINLIPPNSDNFLMTVSASTNAELVQFALNKGANVKLLNSRNQSPLHIALSNSSSLEVVQLLVNAGSDVNLVDSRGRTPLMLAADRLNSEVVGLLLKQKVDVCAKDQDGNTALHYAVENCTKRRIIVKTHIDGLGLQQDPMAATQETALDTLRLLMKHGGDFDKVNNEGVSSRDMMEHISNKAIKDYINDYPSTNRLKNSLSCFGFWKYLPVQSSLLSSCVPTALTNGY